MITSYEKKLVEYLKEGQRVLLRFGHGWGDTQMFIPVFELLKKAYPAIHFDLYVESGQEEIFESIKNKDDPNYDYVFSLDFPMAEGSPETKLEKCCKEELGIEPPLNTKLYFNNYVNPFVAVHFHGTALPEAVGCPEEVAQRIWGEITEAGFIPIECHYEHIFHNPANAKYGFITRHVRDIPARLSGLIGLIQHCGAFIGVASGPLITAFNIMPEKTLFLEKNHKFENYYRYPIAKVNVLDYRDGSVKNWLQEVSNVYQV
jgi:hypothetical protein